MRATLRGRGYRPRNIEARTHLRHEAEQLIALVEALEEDDDVQTVWGNYEMSDEVMARVA